MLAGAQLVCMRNKNTYPNRSMENSSKDRFFQLPPKYFLHHLSAFVLNSERISSHTLAINLQNNAKENQADRFPVSSTICFMQHRSESLVYYNPPFPSFKIITPAGQGRKTCENHVDSLITRSRASGELGMNMVRFTIWVREFFAQAHLSSSSLCFPKWWVNGQIFP